MDEYKTEQRGEIEAAVRWFMSLTREKRETVMILMHGVEIGENFGLLAAQQSTPRTTEVSA